VRHEPHQEVGSWKEVRVENGDELAACDLEAFLERTRLVTLAIGAMNVLDVVTLRREPSHRKFGHAPRFVRRVVEHLDFEKLARIVDCANCGNQPIRDVHFVV
jgi:hypothetical protein